MTLALEPVAMVHDAMLILSRSNTVSQAILEIADVHVLIRSSVCSEAYHALYLLHVRHLWEFLLEESVKVKTLVVCGEVTNSIPVAFYIAAPEQA